MSLPHQRRLTELMTGPEIPLESVNLCKTYRRCGTISSREIESASFTAVNDVTFVANSSREIESASFTAVNDVTFVANEPASALDVSGGAQVLPELRTA